MNYVIFINEFQIVLEFHYTVVSLFIDSRVGGPCIIMVRFSPGIAQAYLWFVLALVLHKFIIVKLMMWVLYNERTNSFRMCTSAC